MNNYSLSAARAEELTPLVGEQHTTFQTVILHLLPGVLIFIAYMLTAPLSNQLGFPYEFAFPLFVVPLVLIPFELGFLLYLGMKLNGRFSLQGIVLYRKHNPIWQYLILAVLLVAWNAAVFYLLANLTGDFLTRIFYFWTPAWFTAETDFAQYSQPVLWIMFIVYCIAMGAAGFVEELYFRGFLLPRISRFGWWSPFINTALFTLYHLDVLGNAAAILVGFLPIAYATYWKKNVYFAAFLHSGLNILNYMIVFFPLLLKT